MSTEHSSLLSPSGGDSQWPGRKVKARAPSPSGSSISSGSSSTSSTPSVDLNIHDLEDPDEVRGRGVAVESESRGLDLVTPGGKLGARGWYIRGLALLCACALSIGSHYGSYFLGPIKSRLSREMGTSNAQFSLLIASFSLNNTWTPLLGGILTARLGTARSSILATSLILSGQLILLLGDTFSSVRTMALGLFVFGLGISPLAVVQETIIVRFFSKHGLGVSLAFGLLAGKGASFLGAVTSYPLSERFGPKAPFVVATILAGISWVVNIAYLSSSAWFATGSGIQLEEGEVRAEVGPGLTPAERMSEAEALRKVIKKKRVKFHNITRLGDIFWAYVGVNVLCGMIWSTFIHLSANAIERRYGLSENEASGEASLLLAGSIFLYPIAGFLTDRLKAATVVHKLFILSSALTLVCFAWLVLPPGVTRTPVPALVAFGLGQGFAPLLLVIIVPHIVPIRYVSTALGAHKSLEQTGSTIAQTLAGLLLDKTKISASTSPTAIPDNAGAIALLLRCFFFVNVLQLLGTIGLWRMQVRIDRQAEHAVERKGYMTIPRGEENGVGVGGERGKLGSEEALEWEEGPALSRGADGHDHEGAKDSDEQGLDFVPSSDLHRSASVRSDRPLLGPSTSSKSRTRYGEPADAGQRERRASKRGLAKSRSERRRGKVFALVSGLGILSAWILFMGVVYAKLNAKAGS